MSVFGRFAVVPGFAIAACLAVSSVRAEPVRVEAAFTRDDNVNRGGDSGDKRSDNVFGVGLGMGAAPMLGSNTRAVLSGRIDADKFRSWSGLDRVSAGAYAELQYRTSAHFFAPTFGLFGRLTFDNTRSDMRDGRRISLGLSVREALSDRISAFAALARNVRSAKSDVFDTKDSAARLNLDYALGRTLTLYLGGEYRRGDVVSSDTPSAGSASISAAYAPDDAFDGELVAYRYDAKTTIWTIGGNWSLGTSSSLDFSARRATSKPTSEGYWWSGSGWYSGTSSYTANLVSVAYLLRF